MNTRFLIVGLGGIGSEIVSAVERSSHMGQRESIRFAALDTDINTLSRIKREGFRGKMIQLSENMTVGEYLACSPGDSERWFMENNILANKPMTEGAGQIRSVSRLAFELALAREKLRPLEECLGELYLDNGQNASTALRIILVSSLAGGTGSGLILPVTLYLRKYLSERLSKKDVIIRGIFLTADCFFSILSSQYERCSLAGNAYAAVKELNAFTKKADGYCLSPRYNQIFLNDRDEKTLACNYYYLFSSHNEKSLGLASFQGLKDYIVQCINVQVLSPIQELNNSIEDNILKSVMTMETADAEFKRYCASGIQILNYPYEEIMEYLALEKARGLLTTQWMAVDLAYEKEKEKQRKRMEEGAYVELTDIGTFMMRYIEAAESSDPFADKIRRATSRQRNGIRENTWDMYIEELEKDVGSLVKNILNECQKELMAFEDKLEKVNIQKEPTRSNVSELTDAFQKLFVQCCKLVKNTVESPFESKYFNITRNTELAPSQFEYWCKNQNEFIHLSAVRYFLYHVIDTAREKQRALIENNEKKYRSLCQIREIALLDDYAVEDREGFLDGGQTEREVEAKQNRISKSIIWNRISLKKKNKISHIQKTYENGAKWLEEYCKGILYEKVLEAGLERFNRLSRNLERFYNAFHYNQERYQNRQDKLKAQWDRSQGTALSYICVDSGYMEKVIEQITDISKDAKGNSALSERIFHQLKSAGTRGEINDSREMDRIYQQDIPEYWKGWLEAEYGHILNQNIIEAIVREGKYLGQDGYTYLEKRLDTAWENTIPRLLIGDTAKGQVRNFCMYHEAVKDMKGRAESVVHSKLADMGGVVSCEEDSLYSITFYKVLYNLSASDISTFAVGSPEIDAKYNSGYSFKAYHQILRLQNKTRLTPHLDKNWSSIFKMQDINQEYTEIRIKQIYKAMFLAWQEGLFIREPVSVQEGGAVRYAYGQGRSRINGTLWQLAEEFAGRPELADAIFRETGERLKDAGEKGSSLEEVYFWRDIKSNQNQGRSIWDMPQSLLKQEPKKNWDDELISYMIEAVMEQVAAVMKEFCGVQEYKEKYKTLILDQIHFLNNDEAGERCREEIGNYLRKHKMYDIDREIRREQRQIV